MYATHEKDEQIININNSNDTFYRYKMPKLAVLHKTNKGRKKTTFPNLKSVSSALKLDQKLIAVYLGHHLKVKSEEDLTLAGHSSVEDVSKAIASLIKECVLCKRCKLPEVKMRLKKDIISMGCLGCGADSVIVFKNKKTETYVRGMLDTGVTQPMKKVIHHKRSVKAVDEDEFQGFVKRPQQVEEDDDYPWSVSTDTESVKARQEENCFTSLGIEDEFTCFAEYEEAQWDEDVPKFRRGGVS